jgi:hypothetical protein
MSSQLIVEVKVKMAKLDHEEIFDLATKIKREADKIEDSTDHEVIVRSYFTTEEGLNCKL